jgi:O-antigen/teichoic acid export membrane protein
VKAEANKPEISGAVDTKKLAGNAVGTPPLLSVLRRSLGWAGAARALTSVGNTARYWLFARLLTPYDFGVTTMALLTVEMLWAMTNASFDKALVQQEEAVEPFLDTVWTTTFARGVLIGALLFVAARPIAGFFRQEEAYVVFLAVAPLALIRGFQSPALVSLFRRLEFRVVLMLNGAELIGSCAVGVLAIWWWGDWRGLVAATIAGQIGRTALSFWYFPYHPRIRFDLALARQMFKFGRWVTGTGIAEFASQQIDNFVVAHVLGPSAVGDYQMAFRIGEMPASELAFSASLVTFPMASRLSGLEKARRQLFLYSGIAVVATGAAYALLILGAGADIIRFALGPKWLGVTPALNWLCLYGLFQGLLILGRSFLDGLGAPEASFNVTLIRALTLALLIYPLTKWQGLSGAGAAALFSVIVPIPLMLILYRRAERVAAARDNQRSLKSVEVSLLSAAPEIRA